MNELMLPRLISSGMVLQRDENCRIWGYDSLDREIIVSFQNKKYTGRTDTKGKWLFELPKLQPGGPYVMTIGDNAGNEILLEDVWVGDVFFCSGQSNMELPMDRVKDAYPKEIKACSNPAIRTFKIAEHTDFHAPLKEVISGEWKAADTDTIFEFSATAYFFAKAYYEMTHIPVGIINASLGGSLIECWMGQDMLDGYDELLALAKQYAQDNFVEMQKQKNEVQNLEWHRQLDSMDIGLAENWQNEDCVWKAAEELEIPFFFKDTKLEGFIGSVWFYKRFSVSEKMAENDAKLWLGTIVDSDTVYVNGIEVGHTDYQYPPRKYEIPKGMLTVGENTIVIRVKCEKGDGRFTPDKMYAVWNSKEKISLDGIWKYRIGATCKESPETDFISWKPTGLYNGMTAPCFKYNISGVLWYQGESNTHNPNPYKDLFERMVAGYRKKWKKDDLPVYYVQLPNFEIDLDEKNSGWPQMREIQRQALQIPHVGMVTAIDLGEDNDLHPLNKKDIGYRLALLAVTKNGMCDIEYSGPIVENSRIETSPEDMGCRVILSCSHADSMYAFHLKKGNEIRDFELVDKYGTIYPAETLIGEKEIIIFSKELSEPMEVRYCYKNTPTGALIYNGSGLPMSPFVIKL